MPLRCSLDLSGPSHRFFGFKDFATPLIDHGQLRKRKRITRTQFRNSLGVADRLLQASKLLKMHAKRQMRLDVIRIDRQDMLQRFDTAIQIALILELACVVIKFVWIGVSHCGNSFDVQSCRKFIRDVC